MTEPLVSVIIIAYTREEFILESFNSVFNQDLESKFYETIVVKNFQNEEIDNYIVSHQGKVINSDDPSLGGKIIEGVNHSKSSIICFLEDDDLYETGKLSHVVTMFEKYPKISYYHNGITFVDAANKSIIDYKKPSEILKMEKVISIKRISNSESFPKRALDVYADFNLSSIVVSKEAIKPKLNALNNRNTIVDTFIFFLSLTYDDKFLLESIPLTRYRVHSGNASFYRRTDVETGKYKDRLFSISSGFDELYKLVKESSLSPLNRKVAQLSFVSKVILSINSKQSRTYMFKCIIELIYTGGVQFAFSRKDSIYYSIIYLVSPKLAIKSYFGRHPDQISSL